MNFAAGESIMIVTRTQSGKDEFGNPVYTETSITAVGAIGPATGTESTNGQDQTILTPQAYFVGDEAVKVDAVLTSTSALTRADGKTYEVNGEPIGMIDNPFTGWQAGIAVPLKRTTG